MSRQKEKNSIPCAFRLNAELVNTLHNFSKESRISNTAIVEMALEQFFANNTTTLAKSNISDI